MQKSAIFSSVALLLAVAVRGDAQVHHPMTPTIEFKIRGEFYPAYYTTSKNQPAKSGFGIGAAGDKLIPYRTIAVDPQRILPGSVVYIPAANGIALPDGEIHDGFFFAHDVDRTLVKDRVKIYIGTDTASDNPLAKAGLAGDKLLTLSTAVEPWVSFLRARFEEEYADPAQKSLAHMVAGEIDALIRETSKTPDIRQRLAIYSERAKGTPYMIFLLGEGPGANYDQDPLLDFARVDCMTFCEQMLAMAISDSYAQMFKRLQRIRYRDGIIDFKTRNHYTIADWLPNNAWLLQDATRDIGGSYVREMTKTIDRPKFFRTNGVPESELADIQPPQTMTVPYVPAVDLPKIKDKLQGGEIVSIVTTMPGIISAHMGMIIRDAYGNVIFRHGSSAKSTHAVVDEYLDEVAAGLVSSKNRVGMIFMRVRPDWQFKVTSASDE